MTRKPLWTMFLSFTLSLAGATDSPTRFMVIKRAGEGTYRLGEVVSGSLRVPNKSSVTVLLLGQGRRWEIVGPAQVKVESDALIAMSGALRELPRAGKWALPSDDNDRQVGGMVVREAGNSPHVESAELEWVGQPHLNWTIPAQGTAPQVLQYEFYETFVPPNIDASQNKVCRGRLGSPFKSGPVLIEDGEYQVPWPESLTPGESAALRLVDSDGREYFYSRTRRPGRVHYRLQAEATRAFGDWLAQEPESSQPLLVYARFLENQGHFIESLYVLGKAIDREGPQPDLLQLRTRILLDCGRYSEALKAYQQMTSPALRPH